MLFVARRGREEELVRVFQRWGLEVAEIGHVTGSGRVEVRFRGEKVGDLPIAVLTDDAPIYRRPVREPRDLVERQLSPRVPEPDDLAGTLRAMLDTPQLGSKAWITRQYDSTVRGNTVRGVGGDAGVLQLKGTPIGIALTCDVNPVYCALDPYQGAMQAVAEAVRNLACVGAEPVGLTDCLNFGNPENPEISWQFREAVRGISRACRTLEVPVVSGNVSFYNETAGQSIHPTPSIAMVGIVPDLRVLPVSWFTEAGDRIIVLGNDNREHGGSAYLRLLHGIEQGQPPFVDLDAENRLAELLRLLIFEGWLHTAHDVSEGGLAVTLAEACFGRGLGAEVEIDLAPSQLFSETQARAVIAVPAKHVKAVLQTAADGGVPAYDAGKVGGGRLAVKLPGAKMAVDVAELQRVWATALPRALGL
jgi:phosphoribosylformylglycinamidine synthase